jgi:hypothetical protein
MLSGRSPYSGDNAGAITFAVLTDRRTPLAEAAPDLPGSLAAVVTRAIAFDRRNRYGSARALREAIERELAAWRSVAGGREDDTPVELVIQLDEIPPEPGILDYRLPPPPIVPVTIDQRSVDEPIPPPLLPPPHVIEDEEIIELSTLPLDPRGRRSSASMHASFDLRPGALRTGIPRRLRVLAVSLLVWGSIGLTARWIWRHPTEVRSVLGHSIENARRPSPARQGPRERAPARGPAAELS